MKALSAALAVLLAGCGSKPTAKHVEPQADYTDQEVATSVRSGYPERPGQEAYHQGKIGDKELVELEARRHREAMSGINAQAALKDMKDAEEKAKLAAGLAQPPMTEEEKAKRLSEIRKALSEIAAYKASQAAPAAAVPVAHEAPAATVPGPATASGMGMTLEPLPTLYKGILVARPPGYLVKGIEAGSLADKAGVRVGDFLVGTNGVYFSDGSEEDLKVRLQAVREFQNSSLDVLRGQGYREQLSFRVGK